MKKRVKVIKRNGYVLKKGRSNLLARTRVRNRILSDMFFRESAKLGGPKRMNDEVK